jgi:hypothetical protein
MALGKRLISTGVADAACTTDSTDPFGDSSGVALYSLDYDASTAPDGTDYSGTPSNVEFGVGGQINYGARFNGSSSYIQTTLTKPSGTAFSFSCWINTSGGVAQHIVGDYNSSIANPTFRIQITANNTLSVGVGTGTGAVSYVSFPTISGLANTWKNLIITVDGTSVNAYINGVALGTTQTSAQTLGAGAQPYTLGAYRPAAGYQNFSGSIDQVRIFSSALDSTQVTQLYNETACVYTCTTDTVDFPTTNLAYYKFDNSSEDYSTGGNDGSDTNIEYRFGRFGQAAVFNGSSSKIVNSSLSQPSGDLSVSLWINFNTIPSGQTEFLDWLGGGTQGTVRLNTISSNNLRFAYGSGSARYIGDDGYTISTGIWYHLVLVIDGSTAKPYFQNNPLTTFSHSGAQTGTGLFLGCNSDANRFSDCTIDQVRIYSTALTSSQVTQLYEEKPCADTSNFKTVLYEGNGTTNYISNVGMDLETDGGLVWVKSRDTAYHHRLVDSVRGLSTDGVLFSNRTNAAEDLPSATDNFTSFDKNGFTLGSTSSTNGSNFNGDSFVAWVWKSGGEAVNIGVNTITASTPSIASDVSANTAAGFSIVKFTVPLSGDFTVGHGLLSTPEMVITKSTDTFNWFIFHKDLSSGANGKYALQFNNTAQNGDYKWWGNGMTDDVLGGTANTAFDPNTETIAYCFHSVAGYSKIGSYTGNETGQTIHLDSNGDGTGTGGFQPSFVMIKSYSSGTTGGWLMFDDKRENTYKPYLQANSSAEEDNRASNDIDFVSTGFQLIGGGGGINNGSDGYIYMAFK